MQMHHPSLNPSQTGRSATSERCHAMQMHHPSLNQRQKRSRPDSTAIEFTSELVDAWLVRRTGIAGY
jgi:hypothetical protein